MVYLEPPLEGLAVNCPCRVQREWMKASAKLPLQLKLYCNCSRMQIITSVRVRLSLKAHIFIHFLFTSASLCLCISLSLSLPPLYIHTDTHVYTHTQICHFFSLFNGTYARRHKIETPVNVNPAHPAHSLIRVVFSWQWPTRNPRRHPLRRSNSLKAPRRLCGGHSGCSSSFARLTASILIAWVNCPVLSRGVLFSQWLSHWPWQSGGCLSRFWQGYFSVSVMWLRLSDSSACLVGNYKSFHHVGQRHLRRCILKK